MARRSPLATGCLWTAIGVIAALGARDLAEGNAPPVAGIPGEASPMDSRSTAEAASVETTPARADEEPPEPEPLLGDALLGGELVLDRAELEDGRYRVSLADGARAELTLVPDVQKAAVEVLERSKAPKAAIVVMSVDGRLLALAGHREGAEGGHYDLPVTVWAPAASVFKVVTTAALLQSGVDPSAEVCYHGGLRGIDRSHLVDSDRDSQCSDLGDALARSQNAVFAKLAHRRLKRGALARAARAFGLGGAPSFALETEESRFEIPEDPLEFARLAAGFWHSELSPLGGAVLAGTIATGGLRLTPRIVSAIERPDGRVRPVESAPPRRVLPERLAEAVAEMMTLTTQTGTAKRGFRDPRGRKFFPDFEVAGKTGSLSRTDPSYLGYSWFVGFAPADDPEVVIAVLLGNPPRWHLKAHTAARLVLQEVF